MSNVTQAPLYIHGLGALSALGDGVEEHREAIRHGVMAFRPLGELIGQDAPHAERYAGWIRNRAMLTNRKWAPASMAALHVARQALCAANWDADDLADAALVLGTSRGNVAGWLGPWPGRRAFKVMAASNTIHSEPATAISIELGVCGPNHLVASGCAAGLDALGLGMMMIRAGVAKRALVVAVDLPLVPILLDQYANSGILSRRRDMDPYSPSSDGFIPSEAAAAVALSVERKGIITLEYHATNSDAWNPLGVPEDGGRSPDLLNGWEGDRSQIKAICPHATGTQAQRAADHMIMRRMFGDTLPNIHLLKPWIGHSIGASGLTEVVTMLSFLSVGSLPPNRPNLTGIEGVRMPVGELEASGYVAKLSHGMGGHNSLLLLHSGN